eukprot:1157345-Pelagomonas_calceolata.AAC.9
MPTTLPRGKRPPIATDCRFTANDTVKEKAKHGKHTYMLAVSDANAKWKRVGGQGTSNAKAK